MEASLIHSPSALCPDGAEFGRSLTAAATLFAVPLVIAPGVLLDFDVTPKLIVLLTGAAILLWLAHDLWAGVLSLWRCTLGRAWLIGIGAMLASFAISTALSVTPALSLAGTTWRRYGLVSQLAIGVMGVAAASLAAQSNNAVRLMVRAVIAAGSIAAAYAVMQSASVDPILSPLLYTTHFFEDFTRPPSTLGHALYLEGFLLTPALSATVMALERQGAARVLYAAAAVLMTLAIVLSGSRSAVLGLVIGVSLLGVSVRAALPWRRVAIGIGAVAVLLAAVIVSPVGEPLRQRSGQRIQDWRGGPRPLLWRDSMTLIGERPGSALAPRYSPPSFVVSSPQIWPARIRTTSTRRRTISSSMRRWRRACLVLALLLVIGAGMGTRGKSYLERGLWAGVAATCVWSMFANLTIATGLMLFASAGILAGARSFRALLSGTAAPLPPSFRWLFRSMAAALVVACLLYTIQDRAFQNAKEFIAQGELASAQGEYASLAALPFPKPGFDLSYSRSMATLSARLDAEGSSVALNAAVESALRAESTSEDRFNALYQSAALALAGGDAATGEAKLRQAIRESPTWYKPRLLLARLLRETGREAEAKREAQSAMELAGARAAQMEKFSYRNRALS